MPGRNWFLSVHLYKRKYLRHSLDFSAPTSLGQLLLTSKISLFTDNQSLPAESAGYSGTVTSIIHFNRGW